MGRHESLKHAALKWRKDQLKRDLDLGNRIVARGLYDELVGLIGEEPANEILRSFPENLRPSEMCDWLQTKIEEVKQEKGEEEKHG